MKELFHNEGTLFTAFNRMGHMVILSILFLLGCIPLITIGTSVTALYYATVKTVRSETSYPAKEFMAAYKSNLGKGSLLTALIFIWLMILYLNSVYMSKQSSGIALTMVMAYNLLFALSAGMMVYLFPVLSRFRMNVMDIVKLSFVMMIRYFYYTILILVALLATAYLQFMILPMMTIFIVPSLFCFFVSFPVENVMKKNMPKLTEGEIQWYMFDQNGKKNLEESKWSVQR